MRISMCSIGWQEHDKWSPKPVIQVPISDVVGIVKDAGYDGIEIWEPHVGGLSDDGQVAFAGRCRELGLAVPMLSGYYNFTKSVEHARDSLAHGHRVLAEARRVGATAIRIFTGNHRSADASEEQWAQAVSCLQELCDDAATTGIVLAAEVHDWNLSDTEAGCLRLIDRVQRPNFKLIFHPSMWTPDPRPHLRRLATHIHHVHATNPGGGGTLASGPIDYAQLITELRAVGYDGFLSVEYFGADATARARLEASFLRGLLGVASVV